MNRTAEPLTVTVPLSFEAHSLAQEYSRRLSNPQKVKQVYLNTLAVYAVDNYLRCLQFETDWNSSDSRNPLIIRLMDVADLTLKNIGKIECRPVLPEAEVCEIPAEVMEDRIGYAIVQLSSDLKSANILGFTTQPALEVPFHQLQSTEDFLIYLSELEQANSSTDKNLVPPAPVPQLNTPELVKLGKWFDGVIGAGWQALDELLNPLQLGVAFKKNISVTRGKKIDLGMQLDDFSVALVVKLTSEIANEVNILIQLHPLNNIIFPAGVQLFVSDESGAILDQVTSREEDNWIQLELSAEYGESFSVTVAYQETEVTQDFVLES